MTERWRVLTLMTTAQAGSSVVQQALGALSPVLVAAFALSKAQLGLSFSAILIGASCFTAVAGVLTDRWGERRMLLVSATIMTVALLSATLVVNYIWLVVMVGAYGAGYAASTPAGGRAILAWFDRDRGFAMGIRQTGVSVGGLIGALVLPLFAFHGGYRAALVFAAVLVAVPSGIAYVLYQQASDGGRERRPAEPIARGLRILIRNPRLIGVTLTCMLLSACQFVLNGFLTITALNVARVSPHIAGSALATAFAASICGRLGWGYVSDRRLGGDRLVPLAIICVLVSIGAAMLAVLRPGAIAPLFLASALLGVSASGWNGLMAAALSEVGGAERAASALGLGLTAIFAASAVGPSLFGLFADRMSLNAAWAIVALVACVAMVPVSWLRGHLASLARA